LIKGPEGDLTVYITLRDQNAGLGHWKQRSRSPTIVELSLMPVTHQWLPIEDGFEHQLIERLVQERRAFVKGLRYNLSRGHGLVNAILTDTGESPRALRIVQDDSRSQPLPADWVWSPAEGAMPPPPTKDIAIRHHAPRT
jgi:hypothetical protein